MATVFQIRLQIKQLMKFRKIARHKMAAKIGICSNTLNTFLLGGNVGLDMVDKIQKFLDENYERMSKLELADLEN